MDGTRVVIADKECAITSGRRAPPGRARPRWRARGYEAERTRYNVVEEVCENCRECTIGTGCPGLTLLDTPLGEKVGDRQGRSASTTATAPRSRPAPASSWSRSPAAGRPRRARPRPRIVAAARPGGARRRGGSASRSTWPASAAWASASSPASSSRPGAARWPEIDVYHKKGIAIRNGGVFSEIVMHDGAAPAPGGDPGRRRRPAHRHGRPGGRPGADATRDPTRTAAVLNTGRTPTVTMLTGRRSYPDDLVERRPAETRPGGLLATDFATACERALGDRIYANIAMLGAAWQRGWLPVERGPLEDAIRAGHRPAGRGQPARVHPRTRHGRPRGAPPRRAGRRRAARAREEGWLPRLRAPRASAGGPRRARRPGLGEAAMRDAGPAAAGDPGLGRGGLRRALPRRRRARRRRAPRPSSRPRSTTCTGPWPSRTRCSSPTSSPARRSTPATGSGSASTRPAGDRIDYVHLNRPALRPRRPPPGVRPARPGLDAAPGPPRRGSSGVLPRWHVRERAFRDWYEGEVVGAVAEGRLSGAAAEEALGFPRR